MKYVTLALWIYLILPGPAIAENGMEAVSNDTTGNVTVPLDIPTEPAANATDATGQSVIAELPAWISPLYPPYEAKGKIDPFVSFIKPQELPSAKSVVTEKKERKPMTPLESVEVNQLKLVGVLRQPNEALAIVEMPDGKGYLIRKGMHVGMYDGVVTAIENEKIVVEEEYVDVFGEAKKRTAFLRLRQEKE